MVPRFSAELRAQTEDVWRAIHAHPFVTGIGDGSLPRDTFAFYLEQDYVYLDGFARVLAVAAAKARHLDDMRRFAALLALTLEEEMALHRRTCAGFGISEEQLAGTQPGMITTAYAGFLLRTCHEGAIEDILAVLLPCASGYVEIAQALRAGATHVVPHLHEWIETYTSPAMVELVDWLSTRVDAMGAGASDATRTQWLELYRCSARFELLFFDMAWRCETWPSIVPV